MCNRAFIITRKDTGCPHSWTITEFDVDIIVPDENKTYQYVISAKTSLEEQIIVTRILEEFFQQHMRHCNIQIIDIPLSRRMRTLLEQLSKDNTIRVNS